MIPFNDIYEKAFQLFDDPKITVAFESDKIAFAKYMYGYLNTVSIFEPVVISQALADVEPPKGQLELFDADGTHNTFELTIVIPEGSYVKCTENGEVVAADINSATNTVTFPDVLPAGGEYGVEYYFPGAYKASFGSISSKINIQNDIRNRVTNILARLIVIAWAESTRDMLVDIQGLLRDTDFKATPNSQILTAKVAWVDKLVRKNNYDQNKLSWMLRYSSNTARFTR